MKNIFNPFIPGLRGAFNWFFMEIIIGGHCKLRAGGEAKPRLATGGPSPGLAGYYCVFFIPHFEKSFEFCLFRPYSYIELKRVFRRRFPSSLNFYTLVAHIPRFWHISLISGTYPSFSTTYPSHLAPKNVVPWGAMGCHFFYRYVCCATFLAPLHFEGAKKVARRMWSHFLQICL